MSRTLLVCVFLLVVAMEYSSAQMDIMQALAIKQRAQSCLSSYLPPGPYSYYLQQQLAVCFDFNCGRTIIDQTMAAYPQYVPTLRRCMGY